MPTSTNSATQFQIRKSDIHKHRLVEHDAPRPGPGQALLKVDRFALTANNVTYALLGESFGYWKFFPATLTGGDNETDDAYGIIPVWGFADVIASQHDSLSVGQRYYGYLPAATHLLVEPGRSSAAGFLDNAPHRQGMNSIYNQYALTSADPGYRQSDEAYQALLRPLFTTSFLLEDFIRDSDYFAATNLIVSSASSKTAYGTAHLLHNNKPAHIKLIALTSKRNRDFVVGLGCYDSVVSYDPEEIDQIDSQTPAAYFDFAGDTEIRDRVHAHFGDRLQHSANIGSAHAQSVLQAGPDRAPAAGPKPELFFAPGQAKKRLREWRPAGFAERMAAGWDSFLPVVRQTIEVAEIAGAEELAAAYAAIAGGTAAANKATIVRL
ncbi:MAG: DUF2855 family protein [bacterium]|nr:DUF2855 family protein [bacterium]